MSVKNRSGMMLKGENQRTQSKACCSATLSTTNPTWADLGANLSLRDDRPVVCPDQLGYFSCTQSEVFKSRMYWFSGLGIYNKWQLFGFKFGDLVIIVLKQYILHVFVLSNVLQIIMNYK
jgi:hypothetical protein